MSEIESNGAPQGERFFAFYNPPVVNRQLGIRRSYIAETRRLASSFLESGQQTLVFANSRLATEILVRYLKDAAKRDMLPPESVRGYRGGYLPRERREIERQLREGEVRAVVATNALELGIDVGSLDTVVMAGYPGTIASTWQRAGRAGRRQSLSLSLLVASSAPLDQFIVQHPSYFFDASPEHAQINPDNLEVLISHVKCAAFEAAGPGRRNVRSASHGRPLRVPGRGRAAASRRELLALDVGIVSRGCGQPAYGHERQLRGRRHHRRAERDRRGRLQLRADDAL